MEGCKEISVRANGLKFVAYERGQGPLVLCLHGFPDHARSFRHQIGPLVAAGYRVVVPYMRGYAPTEAPPDGNYQSAVLGRDVLSLIEALGEERAVVVGHDWGALAAYPAAVRAPHRISKLVTMSIPYGLAFMTAFLSNYEQLKRSWYIYFFQSPLADGVVAADRCAFVRNIWRDWSPPWELPEAEIDAVRDTIAKPGGVEAALGYYRSMLSGTNVDPALAGEEAQFHVAPIEVPTLYIHGDSDGCMDHSLGEGMEAMFPKGLRKHIIAGAGHFLHQEKPAELNCVLLDFLRS